MSVKRPREYDVPSRDKIETYTDPHLMSLCAVLEVPSVVFAWAYTPDPDIANHALLDGYDWLCLARTCKFMREEFLARALSLLRKGFGPRVTKDRSVKDKRLIVAQLFSMVFEKRDPPPVDDVTAWRSLWPVFCETLTVWGLTPADSVHPLHSVPVFPGDGLGFVYRVSNRESNPRLPEQLFLPDHIFRENLTKDKVNTALQYMVEWWSHNPTDSREFWNDSGEESTAVFNNRDPETTDRVLFAALWWYLRGLPAEVRPLGKRIVSLLKKTNKLHPLITSGKSLSSTSGMGDFFIRSFADAFRPSGLFRVAPKSVTTSVSDSAVSVFRSIWLHLSSFEQARVVAQCNDLAALSIFVTKVSERHLELMKKPTYRKPSERVHDGWVVAAFMNKLPTHKIWRKHFYRYLDTMVVSSASEAYITAHMNWNNEEHEKLSRVLPNFTPVAAKVAADGICKYLRKGYHMHYALLFLIQNTTPDSLCHPCIEQVRVVLLSMFPPGEIGKHLRTYLPINTICNTWNGDDRLVLSHIFTSDPDWLAAFACGRAASYHNMLGKAPIEFDRSYIETFLPRLGEYCLSPAFAPARSAVAKLFLANLSANDGTGYRLSPWKVYQTMASVPPVETTHPSLFSFESEKTGRSVYYKFFQSSLDIAKHPYFKDIIQKEARLLAAGNTKSYEDVTKEHKGLMRRSKKSAAQLLSYDPAMQPDGSASISIYNFAQAAMESNDPVQIQTAQELGALLLAVCHGYAERFNLSGSNIPGRLLYSLNEIMRRDPMWVAAGVYIPWERRKEKKVVWPTESRLGLWLGLD